MVSNRNKKTKLILSLFILFAVAVMPFGGMHDALAQEADVGKSSNPYLVETFVDDDGRPIDKIIDPGRPPETKAPVATIPESNAAAGINILSNVPAFEWSYGCSPTAAAMLFGYYDNTGYPNMYTGPTNGGVCPMDNSIWGPGIGGSDAECPLSATHMGIDGRVTKGHVDDYWVQADSAAPDPYIGNWEEHMHGDCTGDFMGSNQYLLGNRDGVTSFNRWVSGDPTYDFTLCEPDERDGCHGLRLFAESRGYTVETNFSQYIYGQAPGGSNGFTFSDFQSEIDAGRPVLIHVEGHTMLGYGYNTAGQIIYIHDTWDHSDHQMTWGGTYSYWNGSDWEYLQHQAVTVIQLESAVAPNNPPNAPSSPSPANHAAGISINADLSWSGGDPDPGDTVTYDVYFGTSSTPPLVSDNQAATIYDAGTLAYNTKYYWYIMATDNHDALTAGPLWDFTTGSAANSPPNIPSSPSPTSHAAGVSVTADLSWIAGDPDIGDTVTYDVYFGTSTVPPLVSDDQPGTTYDPGTLSEDTIYYWYIVATDNHGASTAGPLWEFTTQGPANNPPNVPSGPSPAHQAIGVSINADLSWMGGDPDAGDTVTYDVYFGTSQTPPLVSDNQGATTYDPGTLSYNTEYYWYVVATDSHGAQTGGPLWDFTTGSAANSPPNIPSSPSPTSHATGVSVTADLNWIGGDPDPGDTVTYDVYFGATASPLLVSDDQSATAYDPGALANDTEYYWQIVATDNQGASTTGPLWDFTTGVREPDIVVSPTSFDVTLPSNTIQDYALTISNDGGATLTYSISDKETTGGASAAGREDVTSVKSATMVLEVPLESKPVELQNAGPAATGWQEIMADGFEGMFPGVWELWVPSGATDAYWGKDNYRAHSGSYSAFCAKSGTAGVTPPADYPDGMSAWMIYGPFSLADATDAELEFYFWLDSESDYDSLGLYASINGEDFYGRGWTGDYGGWKGRSFDLTNVYGLGNLCGESQVWIAFIFESDDIVSYEGAFVDDVVLRKRVGAANNPPNTPSNPSPANHATGVGTNADLTWIGGDPDTGDTVTYDVYFGTSATPPLVSNDQLGTAYDPGTLTPNAKYYWKIIATDSHGAATAGPLWDFTTGSGLNNPPNTPSNPSPANHTIGVSVNANLSWAGGDPDAGDTVTYDVCFGTSTVPPLVSDDQSGTTCDAGALAYNTKYYWKVVATDNHGASTTGPLWDFTTGGPGGDCPWLDENPKSGSVPVGGTNDITVTINTIGVAVGSTYAAEIVIASNDPDENPRVVPVTLRVREAGPVVTWNMPWGLDADPSAVNIWTYPGDALAVTLADVDWSMPSGLLIWHYGGPTEGWRFYKKGWGAVNTLETLTPRKGYIGIVPTASVWEIPQG